MRGFTLIELLVVIAIMVILVIVAVPNYNDYSRNQKLAESTNQLQSILRQAQNNAQTGTVCNDTSKALYWHIDLSSVGGSNSSYSFLPYCAGAQQDLQIFPFPGGVTVSGILFKDNVSDSGCSPLNIQIRFSNVSSEVKLIDSDAGCTPGVNALVEITFSLTGLANTRTVIVEKGGGIYVKQ